MSWAIVFWAIPPLALQAVLLAVMDLFIFRAKFSRIEKCLWSVALFAASGVLWYIFYDDFVRNGMV